MGRLDPGPALLLAFLLLLILLVIPVKTAVCLEDDLAEISARSALLMDRETRRVLWESSARERLHMASTTKIMTALLALEHGNEDDIVITSPRAAATEGSSIWLEEGEEKTLRELIYGLILRSGNDAAVAIAEHLGGSVELFSIMMNEKAGEIGAVDTNFKNPHGLPDDNHYTTAYDLALITAYALDNERFREIITTPGYTISWPGHEWDRFLSNQNRLLERYSGGDGVKTGWTEKAGRCFVGSATRDGWQLLAVVLNAPRMWEDSEMLLDYGFTYFRKEKILYQGQVVSSAEVDKGVQRVSVTVDQDFFYPLRPGEKAAIQYRLDLIEKLVAPLAAGCKLGELLLYLDGELIGSIELRSGHAVKRLPVSSYFLKLWLIFLD